MSVRFILGRAGSGKSRFILDEIRAELAASPVGQPLILLVPEQATFQAEYALVTSENLSGMMRAQVLSFRRLAHRIMQETGGTTRLPIDETGKNMMLYKTLQQCREQLHIFQHSVDQLGFVAGLSELLNEMKRYTISPGTLRDYVSAKYGERDEATGMLAHKLHDLSVIYEAYERQLSAEYIDAEEYIDTLAKQLQYSQYIKNARIWIDGFYGFTPQEFLVIKKLMAYGAHVSIALCVDREYGATERPDELNLFHPTATTLITLQQFVDELGVEREETVFFKESVRFHDPLLVHLERYYDVRRPWQLASASKESHSVETMPAAHKAGISLHAAVHRRAEIEGAVREMLRLVREEGYRWRDLAVIVRNPQDYEHLLKASFHDHDIPYFFDQKQEVTDHPLIEFISAALEVVQFNWRYDSVFRCLKTDFLLPLPAEEEVEMADADDGRSVRERPVNDEGQMALWDIELGSLEVAAAEEPLTEREVDPSAVFVVTRHAFDELENYVLAFGIHGERWTDGQAWEYKRAVSLEEEESVTSVQQQLYLQRINDTRQHVVRHLHTFQKEMEAAKTVQDRVVAIYQLLQSVQAAERLEHWSGEAIAAGDPETARIHTQMWGMVMDVLDQIVEVMGTEQLSFDLFTGMLETGFEGLKLGLVPPSIDQVLIGSVDRTRSTKVKVCFVLGVNDGIMPAVGVENNVLSEQEREQLIEEGLAIAPGSRRRLLDEQFLIYTALTTASDHLWLSYPLADEEGKALLPSEVIRRIKGMFPAIQTRFLMAEPHAMFEGDMQLEYIAHPERALSYLVVQLRQWQNGTDIDPIWWDVYNWLCSQQQWRDKLQRLLFGLFYRNEEKPLSERTRRELYGQQLQASVSRMERFVACPFAQFISHGLRLQERQQYRLEAPDIGQLFHAALSTIDRELRRQQLSWDQLTDNQCEQLAKQVIALLSPRLQSNILLSSKRFHYIARKLQRIVSRATAVLSEQARRGAFVPAAVELDFGINRTLPPLSFTLPNGVKMDIIGRIDRVDRADSERGILLRIIDYKSSQTALALSDVYYGLSLQVLTYLDVVVTHAESWLGKKGIPAGALYFHIHHPLLQKHNLVSQEEAEDELFKLFKMRGLVLADREVVQQMDHTLQSGYSDIIPVGLRADGSFYKNSATITEQQWGALRRYLRHTIRSIGTGITEGNVDIKPYRSGQHTPCTYCAYKPICQFDPQLPENEYHTLRRISSDDLWAKFQQEGDDDE